MTKPLSWGVLGAANFAFEHMGPAIHSARGARLTALATSSDDKFSRFSNKFPDLKRHTDYDALLADDGIDAVYIPLPNTLHVEWGLKAMAAGKHVLIEKPVAMKASDIDVLIEARDRTGLMATEAYMIVHHPQWQRAKELVANGAVGDLKQLTCAFSYDNRDPDNIRNKADLGGGALPDIGVYALGCARYVLGAEFEQISAQIERVAGVDTLSRVQGQIAGAAYNGYVSTRMQPFQEVVFHGDAGLIKLTAPFNPNVYGMAQIEVHQGGDIRMERFPAANHYVNQVEAFCASVGTGVDYPWSLEDAKGTQALIDAVFAAAG
ncbi:MAG: Gfo/Idh/MocA family oxidoreductase [Litoreibacter sp.]|uniref:Gfo/Idh/MocA family protein n=1 Tax=Litoreibacter sp. TaxID=1969459 RepID=UPI00329898F8